MGHFAKLTSFYSPVKVKPSIWPDTFYIEKDIDLSQCSPHPKKPATSEFPDALFLPRKLPFCTFRKPLSSFCVEVSGNSEVRFK